MSHKILKINESHGKLFFSGLIKIKEHCGFLFLDLARCLWCCTSEVEKLEKYRTAAKIITV
jgi:hypothetical protein